MKLITAGKANPVKDLKMLIRLKCIQKLYLTMQNSLREYKTICIIEIVYIYSICMYNI